MPSQRLVDAILSMMEKDWTNHGMIGEEYSEKVAVEVALNELIDFAVAKDMKIAVAEGSERQITGVTVWAP